MAGWVKWWDRFWGAVWVLGSAGVAYWTARWFALNAARPGLGPLRYGLVAFAFLFGLLVGMALLSLAIIGLTVVLERLFARLGVPVVRPGRPAAQAEVARPAAVEAPPARADASLGPDTSPAEGG